MVRPLKPDRATPMSVVVVNGQGKPLTTIPLDPPDKLPKTAYHVEGAPAATIDFAAGPGSKGSVDSHSLAKLDDPSGAFLQQELQSHDFVEISTADGSWVRNIYLPDKSLEGKVVRVRSQAQYQSTVHYSRRQLSLVAGQTVDFKFTQGQWLYALELENSGLVYATDTWSGVLLAEVIAPGMRLQIKQGELSGELTRIKVGAPTQLLIHTIDVGMLVPPRGEFAFAKDRNAHREYFQTVPTSRLIVAQYAPLWLKEVMLPTGKLITDSDPSKGGWHEGDMRQNIGKELISHGIDNANYGINSLCGVGEAGHPYIVAQLAAHNSRGKYANGIQVHGGSGGDGMVTLDQSVGNELSHEVGHNYGLGHFVGGFKGSVHRGADESNSTWGWDPDKNRFIPNFAALPSGRDTCVEGQCQKPFADRSYGVDAMAGGEPMSGLNRFTMYTPFTAATIQRFLESKAVFDPASPTGFSKWNSAAGRMQPYTHRINNTEEVKAAVDQLSDAYLAKLLIDYDRVAIEMGDGNQCFEGRCNRSE